MTKALIDTLRHNMRQALRARELADAEQILERLKKEDPLSRDTRGLELEFYLSSNRLDDAVALGRQLSTLFPDSGRILFLVGKLEYRLKRYAEAAAHFRESLRLYQHVQTRHWLGKTLTQMGDFAEAESLLLSVVEDLPSALLDLAWLYERTNDLEAALKACDDYLQHFPGNAYAAEQRMRMRARMLEPDTLIEEVDSLAELGEDPSDAMFSEFVARLFETGQTPRARQEIVSRLEKMDGKLGIAVAWVCYQAQAYDLAATLFIRFLQSNLSNFKYLNALESAASKSNRLSQVVESYRALASQAGHLHGRIRSLGRHQQQT